MSMSVEITVSPIIIFQLNIIKNRKMDEAASVGKEVPGGGK